MLGHWVDARHWRLLEENSIPYDVDNMQTKEKRTRRVIVSSESGIFNFEIC